MENTGWGAVGDDIPNYPSSYLFLGARGVMIARSELWVSTMTDLKRRAPGPLLATKFDFRIGKYHRYRLQMQRLLEVMQLLKMQKSPRLLLCCGAAEFPKMGILHANCIT